VKHDRAASTWFFLAGSSSVASNSFLGGTAFAHRPPNVFLRRQRNKGCHMFKQRFLPGVLLALSSLGLLFVSAGSADAWGGYGYGSGPSYGGWGWMSAYNSYPYGGYTYGAYYSPWSGIYWGAPYANHYGNYGSPYATFYLPYTYRGAPGYTYAAPSTTTTQSAYYTPSVADNRARVTVEVPPTAHVWIEGQAMTQQGTVRKFNTPPLETGHQYTYAIRASWLQNGVVNDQTQNVRFQPGQDAAVRFGP
jgi:uncharacterized protein (TIGR03000 family)